MNPAAARPPSGSRCSDDDRSEHLVGVGIQMTDDPDSYAVSGYHTVYLDEGGWFTVQGDRLDADTHANLEDPLPGEGAVQIKPEVVIEAVRQYLGRLP